MNNFGLCLFVPPFLILFVQEEIKIIEVEVYVNPYTELDEEEEEKNNNEGKVEDEENVSSSLIFGYTFVLGFPFYLYFPVFCSP